MFKSVGKTSVCASTDNPQFLGGSRRTSCLSLNLNYKEQGNQSETAPAGAKKKGETLCLQMRPQDIFRIIWVSKAANKHL